MKLIYSMMERLAEMFPKQDYQSRLDRYVAARGPKTAAEVDHYIKSFQRNEFKGLSL